MPEYDPSGIYREDGSSIIVSVGIDGQEPPLEILRGLEEGMNQRLNSYLDYNHTRQTVVLNTDDHISSEIRESLGRRTLHVQQYDVSIHTDYVPEELEVNVAQKIIRGLDDLDFNIVGWKSKVVWF